MHKPYFNLDQVRVTANRALRLGPIAYFTLCWYRSTHNRELIVGI